MAEMERRTKPRSTRALGFNQLKVSVDAYEGKGTKYFLEFFG